jgi:hypothetical protein
VLRGFLVGCGKRKINPLVKNAVPKTIRAFPRTVMAVYPSLITCARNRPPVSEYDSNKAATGHSQFGSSTAVQYRLILIGTHLKEMHNRCPSRGW